MPVAVFTPNNNIAVTRMQATVVGFNGTCLPAALMISDGTTRLQMAITAATLDVSPVPLNYNQRIPLRLSVEQTLNSGCNKLYPVDINVVVQYSGRP